MLCSKWSKVCPTTWQVLTPHLSTVQNLRFFGNTDLLQDVRNQNPGLRWHYLTWVTLVEAFHVATLFDTFKQERTNCEIHTVRVTVCIQVACFSADAIDFFYCLVSPRDDVAALSVTYLA